MNPKSLPLGLLIVVLAFAAHARSLSGGFHYDDENVILANRANLEDAGTIVRILAHPELFAGVPGNPTFRPVTYASHVLDSHVWGWRKDPDGPNPLGWHLTNVLLHAGTAWVLYHLLRRLLGTWLRGSRWPRARPTGRRPPPSSGPSGSPSIPPTPRW